MVRAEPRCGGDRQGGVRTRCGVVARRCSLMMWHVRHSRDRAPP
jgi:hypothetical protein